jgi:hypothetical protein
MEMGQPSKPPKDCVGNELHEGDVVTLHIDRPLIFLVSKIDNGGIQTPQGITPGRIVLGVNLTLHYAPGMPLLQVVRVVNPGSDKIVEKLLSEN